MKQLLLTFIISVFSIFGTSQAQAVTNDEMTELDYESQFAVTEQCNRPSPDYCGNNSLTNGLGINQTTLFYMYSDNVGHYFIDPLAIDENIIYVGLDDYKVLNELEIDTDELHHGKRFIGTFEDGSLWELVGLEEVEFVESELE